MRSDKDIYEDLSKIETEFQPTSSNWETSQLQIELLMDIRKLLIELKEK